MDSDAGGQLRHSIPVPYVLICASRYRPLKAIPVQLVSPCLSHREAEIYCQMAVSNLVYLNENGSRPNHQTQGMRTIAAIEYRDIYAHTYVCTKHTYYFEISNLSPFHPYLFSSQLEIENKFCFSGLPGLPVWVYVAPGLTLALVSGKQHLLAFGLVLASILNNVVRVVTNLKHTGKHSAGLGVAWGPL